MNISECFDFLNFWINKFQGEYFTISELELITDRGQMSLYSDLQPKYATSQHIKDALSPFRSQWDFTTSDSNTGIITIPASYNFMNLLDLTIQYNISDLTRYAPVTMVNEDVIATKLNSQVDPVTVTNPIGEVVGSGVIKIYPPTSAGYTGTVRFLRRPVKPVFAYSVISARVIVYDPVNSVQLQWGEEWQNAVLLKALQSVGINISDQEVQQWAQIKTEQNFGGQNRT